MKQVKTIRISDDLDKAMQFGSERQKIENSQSLRKLANMGFETYVAHLYSQGKIALREAAKLLRMTLSELIVLMKERGVSGNTNAEEVLQSVTSLSSLESHVMNQVW